MSPLDDIIRIGSRGSQLALWQAEWVRSALAAAGQASEIEILRTTGDRITDVPLAKIGTKGLFTKELEEALLDGRIDLAVHSLKDMPTELPDGLALVASPEREDPRDALVGCPLAELRAGDRVGTSSLRRSAQLRAMRPDLVVESVRGNVDTRIRKMESGEFRAILLAAAGLRRLGWMDRIAQFFEPDEMVPAPGQGALAIEGLVANDRHLAAAVLEHTETRAAVTAERAFLAAIGGGCQVPAGAHARLDGDTLALRAVVLLPDGSRKVEAALTGAAADASRIGAELGARILSDGGREILDAVYGTQ